MYSVQCSRTFILSWHRKKKFFIGFKWTLRVLGFLFCFVYVEWVGGTIPQLIINFQFALWTHSIFFHWFSREECCNRAQQMYLCQNNHNNSSYLWNNYTVPDTILSVLFLLSHLILTTTLSWYYNYLPLGQVSVCCQDHAPGS